MQKMLGILSCGESELAKLTNESPTDHTDDYYCWCSCEGNKAIQFIVNTDGKSRFLNLSHFETCQKIIQDG